MRTGIASGKVASVVPNLMLAFMLQASGGGLLGRFKSLFNLGEASDPQNPSPSDVSKDIASRLSSGGGGGISAVDEQSPGAHGYYSLYL